MRDPFPTAGGDDAPAAGESDDSDSTLESTAGQGFGWRRAVAWLSAVAVVAILVLGARVAGERFYNPDSRIPPSPPYPLHQGLLGVNQPVLSELQSVMTLFPEAGGVHLVINTTAGAQAIADSYEIRRTALVYRIPHYTTLAGARAAVLAIATLRAGALDVVPLQFYSSSPF